MTREVLPPGTYELKLMSEKAEEKKSDPIDKATGKPKVDKNGKLKVIVPYVGGFYFETTDEKKTRTYHSFFLSLVPGSDGILNPNRGGGIAEFAQATGNGDFEPSVVEGQLEDSEGQDVPFLNPQEIIEFLKGLDGTIVKVVIKNEMNEYQGKKELKHQIDYFVAEDAAPAEVEEEAPAKVVAKPALAKKKK